MIQAWKRERISQTAGKHLPQLRKFAVSKRKTDSLLEKQNATTYNIPLPLASVKKRFIGARFFL